MNNLCLLLIVFVCLSLTKADAGKEVHTFSEWKAIIYEDSKIASIEERLGKPNDKEEGDAGRFRCGITLDYKSYFRYTWFNTVDVGTTSPKALKLIAMIDL